MSGDTALSGTLQRLQPYPGRPTGCVQGLEIELRADGEQLQLDYRLQAPPGQLCLPAWQGVRPGEQLWRHTCFELFVRDHASSRYLEFNFSPCGAYACYAFDTYRQASAAVPPAERPDMAVVRLERVFQLKVSLPLTALAALRAPYAVALSTVVEDCDGALSYWALRHPADKPDFHHPEAFVLRMDASGHIDS